MPYGFRLPWLNLLYITLAPSEVVRPLSFEMLLLYFPVLSMLEFGLFSIMNMLLSVIAALPFMTLLASCMSICG